MLRSSRVGWRWLQKMATAYLPPFRSLPKQCHLQTVQWPCRFSGTSRQIGRTRLRVLLDASGTGSIQRESAEKKSSAGIRPSAYGEVERALPYVKNLNEDQFAATVTDARLVRVKAGPGSGKTRVVVARTVHLINSCGVNPARILVITFTNKAANELKERLAVALGTPTYETGGSAGPGVRQAAGPAADPTAPQVLAKTFHSLGSYVLRKSGKRVKALGIDTGFKVYDSEQCEKLLAQAVENVEERRQRWLKEERGQEARPLDKDTVSALVSRLIDTVGKLKTQMAHLRLHNDKEVVAAVSNVEGSDLQIPIKASDKVMRSAGVDGRTKRRWTQRMVQWYFNEYQRLLRRDNAVDFSDLICLPVRLLDTDPDLAEHWRSRFDHILVDEFQDTDFAQYRFVKMLRAEDASLFVVGDTDQAIYGWRGAQPGNMKSYLLLDFKETVTYNLPTNYRSYPEIVVAAEDMLSAGEPQDARVASIPARKRPPASDPPLHYHLYDDPRQEALHVTRRIQGWKRDGSLGPAGQWRYREVAILYRKRDQSRPLEEQMTLAGLPFVVLGGKPFWQYKEVYDSLAFLHVLLDPLRSEMCLQRIINEPKRGIGDKALESLQLAAEGQDMTLGALLFSDCLATAATEGQGGQNSAPDTTSAAEYSPAIEPGSHLHGVKMTKTVLQGIQELRGLVSVLRRMANGGAPVHKLLETALKKSGYMEQLELQLKTGHGKKTQSKTKDAAQEAAERLRRLETLGEVAKLPENWVADEDVADPDQELDDAVTGSVAAIRSQNTDAAEEAETESSRGSRSIGKPEWGRQGRGLPGLRRFLEHAALVTGMDADGKGDREAVRLMTLHAAKGLEFERVFIVGLEDGILPASFSNDHEEERRLLYVGVTRARDKVYLSSCRERMQYGMKHQAQPSSFLNSLEKHYHRSHH